MAKCHDCSSDAITGMSRCANCLHKHKMQQREYNKKYAERLNEMDRRRKQNRIDNNLCRSCGKPLDPDVDKPRVCINCNERIHREVF